MDLYVANPSKQDHDLVVLRVEQQNGRNRFLTRPLPAGGQVKLSGLSTPDITACIEHYRRYGALTVSEAKKEKGFVNLIYSDEKPITFDNISAAAEHNIGELDELGRKMRQTAAVVADQAMLGQTMEGTTLKASVVDVVEQPPADKSKFDMPSNPVNETRRVEDRDNRTDRRGKNRVRG